MASYVGACERVAAIVRDHALSSVSELSRRYEQLRLPSPDPLEIAWDPFAMFDSATDERAWTEWLGSLLQSSSRSREAVWDALLDVVLAQVVSDDAINGMERERLVAAIRGAHDVRKLKVTVEAPTMDGGFLDLIIDTPGLVVGIENKLWEGWHDRENNPQDSSYRRWILATSGGVPSIAVFLSAYEAGEAIRRAGWCFTCWGDVALALRRRLRALWSGTPPTEPGVAIELAPALCTVAAIERHLLGLRAPAPAGLMSPVKSLDDLSNLIRHLERAHV